MTRSPDTITADIDALQLRIRREQQLLAQLEDERNLSRTIHAAQGRQRQHVRRVVRRMEDGEYIVVTTHPWWCRDGQLIERADGDDMQAIYALALQGVVGRESRRWSA